jgi:heptosyltransferase-2
MSSGRVLVVGPAWIGDMVMAQSLFKAMAAQDPASGLDVLAPNWSLPLLERMPEVSAVIVMPLSHGQLGLRTRYRLGRRLRGRYRRAIILPNSYKSALVPFWARIPQRTGYLGEHRYGVVNDIRTLDKSLLPMTVQRFVALAHAANPHRAPAIAPPSLRVDRQQARRAVAGQGLNLDRPVLALCPGAEYGSAKRWPPEYFAQVAIRQRQAGWQSWVFGSANDRALGREIATRIGEGCRDLTGSTTLAEAIDLLSLASAVVSNDSGLMHVAAALHRPLVALFGSSDPGFTPPLDEHSRVLRLGLDCSPCFQRECPLGHTRCLRDLHPDRVHDALTSFGPRD